MRRLQHLFPDTLAIVGVHSAKFPAERTADGLREAVHRLGIEHPVISDPDHVVWNAYAVRAWPTLVLVDAHGYVAGRRSGEVLAEDLELPVFDLVAAAERDGILNRAPLTGGPVPEHGVDTPLLYPSRVLVAEDDRLFVADTGHHRILELRLAEDRRTARTLRSFGSGEGALHDGNPDAVAFQDPRGMSLDGGRLYVADTGNHAIRAMDLETGYTRTVAGTGQKAHGRMTLAEPLKTPLRSPWAVHAESGVVLIAMAGAHQVWVLLNEERIGPFAGSGREALVDGPPGEAGFNQPSDLAWGMGHLFVADAEASAIRAVSTEDEPRVMTLAGQGLFEFGDVDGQGAEVRLQHPTGIAYADGLLYIADSYNHKVKTLDPTTGEVRTLIGTGFPGSNDGAFAEATLHEPEGIVVDGPWIFIADTNNHRVRVANQENRRVWTLEML